MSEWVIKRLGDVCQIDKSQGIYSNLPYVGLEDIESNTARFIGSTNPKSVKSSSFKFTTHHLLYGRLRPYLNKVIVPSFEGHCSTEIFPIKPRECLDKYFLLYWFLMSSTVREINATCTGARMPRANMDSVLKFEFPLPPISEQKRIVAILDEAFEGIDRAIANTEKNLTNVRELFESHLNAIFTQRSDGWISATVGELVDQLILEKPLDGNHGEIHPKKSDFVKAGVPFIMASDLINGIVDQENCNFITREQANSLRKGFAKDSDVLLSHKGTIGRAAILTTSHPNVVLTPQVTYYRVIDKSVLYNKYLYYFFHSPSFQNEIQTIARAGSTRAYIGITSQLSLKISYPKIDDQKRYADSLDSLISETQRLEAIYQQKLAALNELKQSILQKAFAGKLASDTSQQATETAKKVVAA